MRWIIGSSLRLSVVVLVAVGLIMVVGFIGLSHASVDTLPEFLPPQVQVQTEALGLSAAEVEQFITVPLEDEFNGLAFLDHLRSRSVPGLSSIELTFKPGTDIYKARQLVTERVAQGPSVVNVGTPPVMIQPLSAEGRAMMIGLSSRSVSMIDLSTLARWRIRPRLLAVPGVANVTIWGERDQQLQVLVDPARLAKHGVSLEQVINTAGDAMWTSPLTFVEASSPGADGFIDTPNQRVSIQHILPIKTAKDLAAVPVEDTTGKRVLLGQVTTVVEDHPALRGDAVLKDGPAFLLVVEKFPGANTLEVTRGVQTAMAELKPGLAGVTVDTTVFRPATFIETALRDVGLAALVGTLLLVLWLGVSTRSWRVALIGLLAFALCVIATGYVLYLRGTTFNTMILAGLVIALGVIVDDIVVAVVAIKRRLGARRETGDERSKAAVVTDAYVEVRRPLTFALGIVLLAMVPLLVLSGLSGALAWPMTITYLLTVLVSTAVALTATPVLAFVLLPAAPSGRRESAVARALEWMVARAVPAFVRRSVWAWVAVAVLAVMAVAIVPRLGGASFMPPLQDRNLLIHWQATPGASLPEMERVTSRAAAALRAVSGVRGVATDLGQALMGDQVVDVDSAQTWVVLDPKADYATTTAAVRRTVDQFPGLGHSLRTYPEASIGAAATDTGRAVTVRLYGTDGPQLQATAQQLRQTIAGVPGVVGPRVQTPAQEPTVQIHADVAAAARYGLKPGDIRRATAVLVAGIPVGSYYQQQQIFDVTVWSKPSVRQNVTAIHDLLLDTPSGGQVPLNKVATVSVQPAPTEIAHDQVSRYVDVTAGFRGGDLGAALKGIDAKVQAMALPLGYHVEVSSALQQQRAVDLRVWLYVLAVAAGVFLLLQAAFRSWGRAALLFFTLPLAGAGGALVALMAGRLLTVGALIGFVVVFGVAVRQGILLVSRVRELEQADGDANGADLVVRACREASFPVAVTAVGLALVMLPFVLRGDVAGTEILRPLALVVLGGLVTWVFYTLFVLPGLYLSLVLRDRRRPAVVHDREAS